MNTKFIKSAELIKIKQGTMEFLDQVNFHFHQGNLNTAYELVENYANTILDVMISAPALRYWQYNFPGELPTVWASTRNEYDHKVVTHLVELDYREFEELRKQEWAMLATPQSPTSKENQNVNT